MTIKRRTSSLWIGLSLPFIFGMASLSHALVVTPARTEIHLAGGATTQMTLTATNDDKVEIEVDLSKKDWFIPDVNKAWTVDRWMTLQSSSPFYLKPGESQTVNVSLVCPKEMQGEVVGMVSFLYKTEHPGMVTPMISVSVYLLAAGTEKPAGVVEDLMVRKMKEQITIAAQVNSTGNVHLRPGGRMVVTDSKGHEVGEAAVAEGQPAYPGREVVYFGVLPSTVKLVPGTYQVKADLSYQTAKLQGVRNFKVMPDGQIQMVK